MNASEPRTINFSEIGVAVRVDELAQLFNEARSGTFSCVRGYQAENGHGEVADFWIQHGVSYDSIKEKSRNRLLNIMNGYEPLSLDVVHGAWIDDADLSAIGQDGYRCEGTLVSIKYDRTLNGVRTTVEKTAHVELGLFGNRKAKDRTPVTLSYSVNQDHPLFVQAVQDLLQSFDDPKPSHVEYDNFAKGGYSLDGKAGFRLYIRDCLIVHKCVRQAGDYPFKASLPLNAVKEALRRLLPIGKYRQFILDGRFESVTLAEQSVLQDGLTEELYFALPEHVEAALHAEPAQGALSGVEIQDVPVDDIGDDA